MNDCRCRLYISTPKRTFNLRHKTPMPVSFNEMRDLFPPAVVQAVVDALRGGGFSPALGRSWGDDGCFEAQLTVGHGGRVVRGYIVVEDDVLPSCGVASFEEQACFTFKIKGEDEWCFLTVGQFYEWIQSRF